MFRRRSTDVVTDQVADEPVADEPVESGPPKSYTPKKGEATPKRVIAGRRPVETAPADRKEALKRSREKQRQDRVEQRAAMMAGDERYLLPRDRGPEKAIARDIVDSRYNIGTVFIFALLAILIGSTKTMPTQVQFGANLLFVFMIVALLVDSVIVCRKVRRLVRERLPKASVRWGSLYFYTIMRSISFRRLRVPKPRVMVGQQI